VKRGEVVDIVLSFIHANCLQFCIFEKKKFGSRKKKATHPLRFKIFLGICSFYMMREEKLLLLLKRKRDFFESILELSEAESQLTLEEWISVLEQKKVLLSCIERIDTEIDPFRESLPTLSQEVADELESIRYVIHQILHLDAKNQKLRKEQLK
jgi:hypothetical protein